VRSGNGAGLGEAGSARRGAVPVGPSEMSEPQAAHRSCDDSTGAAHEGQTDTVSPGYSTVRER
jgi:hypothetical protein